MVLCMQTLTKVAGGDRETKEASTTVRDKMLELAEDVRALRVKLISKDHECDDLRIRLNVLEPLQRMHQLHEEDAAADGGGVDPHQARMQKVARQSMARLQTMLEGKNEAIARYQEMLRKTREEFMAQKELDELENQRLREQLGSRNVGLDETIQNLRERMAAVKAPSQHALLPSPLKPEQLTRAPSEKLAEVRARVSAALAFAIRQQGVAGLSQCDRTPIVQRLQIPTTPIDKKIAKIQEDYTRQVEGKETELGALQVQNQEMHSLIAELKQQLDDTRAVAVQRGEDLTSVQGQLEEERAGRQRNRPLERLVQQLRSQLEVKEKKQKELTNAIKELRAELLQTADQTADREIEKLKQGMKDEDRAIGELTKNMHDRMVKLQAKMDKMSKEAEVKRLEVDEMKAKRDAAEAEAARQDTLVRKQTAEMRKMAKQARELATKVEEQAAELAELNKGNKPEVEQLQKKIRLLQDQLAKSKSREEAEGSPPKSATGSGLPRKAGVQTTLTIDTDYDALTNDPSKLAKFKTDIASEMARELRKPLSDIQITSIRAGSTIVGVFIEENDPARAAALETQIRSGPLSKQIGKYPVKAVETSIVKPPPTGSKQPADALPVAAVAKASKSAKPTKLLRIAFKGDARDFADKHKNMLSAGVATHLGCSTRDFELSLSPTLAANAIVAELSLKADLSSAKLRQMVEDLEEKRFEPLREEFPVDFASLIDLSSSLRPDVDDALTTIVEELGARHESVVDLMARLDRNKDRMLSHEELCRGLAATGAKVASDFSRLTHFCISSAVWESCFAMCRQVPTPVFDALFKVLDKDGKGTVDYIDFYKAIKDHREKIRFVDPPVQPLPVSEPSTHHAPPLQEHSKGSGKENNDAVGKWLADKNMERKLERLKAKLAEKEKELQHVQAKETSLSSVMEKERSRLTSRVHELEQQLDKMRRGVAGGMPDWASIQNAKALQARVFELEGELQRLQRQLEVLACVGVDAYRWRLESTPALLGSSRVMHAWA